MDAPRPRRPRPYWLAIAALTPAIAAGCGGGTVIDHRAAAIDVREGFEELGTEATRVACAEDVEARRGALYACRAVTPKGTFRVLYRQLDEEGSMGPPRLVRLPG